jgi:hypothetical protein
MQNRISDLIEEQSRQDNEPQPIGEILEELLAQYERRFPGIRISVLETAATAV